MNLRLAVSAELFGASVFTHQAAAENLNVSSLAISGRFPELAGEANAPVASSDAALTYYRIDRARVQDDTADYFVLLNHPKLLRGIQAA